MVERKGGHTQHKIGSTTWRSKIYEIHRGVCGKNKKDDDRKLIQWTLKGSKSDEERYKGIYKC